MEYLIKHAFDNVWCSPRQDRQFITRPKRISKNGGEIVQIESDWLQVYLPDNKNYYHLYQIGQIHPNFLGLFPVMNKWVSLQEVCNKMGMIADLYSGKGVLCPKFETYYMVTAARNLIIATRKRSSMLGIDYNTEDLFFRVYTNAFFQSARSITYTERIVTKGKSPTVAQDILTMQTEFNTYRAKTTGYAWAIINGYFYEEISPLTCKVGDLVEWIYDSSIQRVVEFKIDELPNFDSIRDSERKYLLHYPGVLNRIDYQDDVEVFLLERPTSGKPNGLYHHKNTAAAMRMLTHKDYSVSVQLINAFVDGHPRWTDPQKLRLVLFIRKSGWDRPLVFENSRIHELYKLNDVDILPAMVGDNATVPSWRAANLENSKYPLIMEQEDFRNITRSMVQQAYGYNALSKLMGDTPKTVEVVNGNRMINMPRGHYENSTVYEYDADGLLLGWYYHAVGTQYILYNDNAVLVETIYGRANHSLDENYDLQIQEIDPNLNYRMYTCDKIGGVSQNNWRDVTNTGNYAIVNGILTWLVNMTSNTTLVRSDKNALGYIFQASVEDGLLEFDLTKIATRNGISGIQLQDIPMGEMDIWLNGRSIAHKTDYVVRKNKVIVYNKRYLINPETQMQEIAIRASGFCKSDLTREEVEDRGFVKWELLSRNSVYNLRDDRVMRIVVDGRLYHRNSLKFSEKDQAYMLPSAKNGDPYSIRDMVVPMRSLTDGDTYTMRDASRVIDAAVGAYLGARLPEPEPTGPNVIEELYPIFTPFLCKILYDLVDGVIPIAPLKLPYDGNFVRSICAPYEYILEFDPTQTANAVNTDYVIIHPHYHGNVMDVDIYHYKFLEQVIKIYMTGKVKLNHFLRLAAIT